MTASVQPFGLLNTEYQIDPRTLFFFMRSPSAPFIAAH
jgi:hypothetical protein